ncbi:MAG: DNA topoisomerase IV subunit A [Proteobacteria bacterium]|nr:DNA topoisomerase IV subunit A [Pseudomonadota bacterium]
MTKHVPPPEGERVFNESLTDALSKRYLAYALSTITGRALPDVRDGLKPVHRRLLYAMRQMRLSPEAATRKCAKVVGEVMGNYHPHGDSSIYDALVRLAQEFSQRYPLIEGQGNFGNLDGDNPAAMRYTECRLTPAAELLLNGIDEDAVDFRPTYDESDTEPSVLPGGFPNLLANGSSGIAVGMATSIPPHNAGELIDACLLLLLRPEATTADLMERVLGPDFPTGGVCVESRASMLETYDTGRGGLRLRARWTVEDLGRGTWRVVVTEMPYQVPKAKLVEDLAAILEAKKAPLLLDVRDESAEDVRLVLEPRSRSVDPEAFMESLFRLSDLEVRFPVNMNVLDARGTPRVMGLKPALQAFLEHRREVLVRRSRWRLARIEARMHILDGLLIAYLNLDEVIRIVRYEEEPKARLIEAFALSDVQAEAILNTRLRQLARLEEMEIRREHEALAAERAGIEELLGSERKQWSRVGDQLREARKVVGSQTALGRRRTTFADAPVIDETAAVESLVAREPITVVLSERGWIRAVRGKVEDTSELKFKEGDKLGFVVPAFTTDKVLVFASDGRVFTLAGDKLPPGRGHGEPLRLLVDLDERVKPVAVLAHKPGRRLLVASKTGYGFLVPEVEVLASKRGGKQVLNVDPSDPKAGATLCQDADGDHVALLGDNNKILICLLTELPEMGRGRGVRLQSYKEGGLKDALVFKKETGPAWIDSTGKRREWKEWDQWVGKRAIAGKIAPRGFRRFAP